MGDSPQGGSGITVEEQTTTLVSSTLPETKEVLTGEENPESKRQSLQNKYEKLKAPPVTAPDSTPSTTDSPTSNSEPGEQPQRHLGLGRGTSSIRGSPGTRGKKPTGVPPRVRGGQSPRVEEIKNPDCLLVEDVRVSQKIAQMALKRARHTVDVAASGEEAVEKFKKHYKTLKLVLMDIMLPKMSGVEATQIIREFESKQPGSKRTIILGLTGNVSEVDLQRYKEADMNGCIAKGELLADAVSRALEKLQAKPTEFVLQTEVGSSGPSHG